MVKSFKAKSKSFKICSVIEWEPQIDSIELRKVNIATIATKCLAAHITRLQKLGMEPPQPPSAEETTVEQRAEALKAQGNEKLAQGHFNEACEFYTQAIELHETAVYYANRSLANLKCENYGSAINDATLAIELDATYVKAYYRRGSAHFALNKYKLAVKDFKAACKMVPKDKAARAKLKECEKAYNQQKFYAAIESEQTAPYTMDPAQIVVDESYNGPHIDSDAGITIEFVRAMVEWFKDMKMIHRKYAVMILNSIKDIFDTLPNCVAVETPRAPGTHLTVCGDVHGQFYDLLNIFKINGEPSETNPYLFNGDFVDRGSFSLEVILTLFAFKCVYPNSLHLTRGNHESKNMNKIYGFEGEVNAKLDSNVTRFFTTVFCKIPLCAILEDKVFVVHGGLPSQEDASISDINAQNRDREPPESGIMCDLLWADPQPAPGRAPSKRGVGFSFGPDVTEAFLAHNNLNLVVRSHEVRDEGYEEEHGGKLITVFSAPNYCDQMGNKGAFIHFTHEDGMVPHFTKFEAVPHPPVRPMQYASPLV